MKKRRVSPSIHVSKPTETAAAPSDRIALDENAPVDENGERIAGRTMTAFRRLRRQLDWSLIWTILAIKGVILLFGAQSYLTWTNKPIGSLYGWLEIWNRWDSLRHIRLAQIGYKGVGSERADLIGFPLYPWLVRLFAAIFQDYLISAFVVSGLALIAAGLLLYKLTRIDFPDLTARNAVWFMLIFPTAYFLHINYNESLFIALTVGCFLAARRENWWLAGMLGIFVCLTPLNGLVVVPALLTEAFLQYRTSRRWRSEWLWILAAPLGFGAYLLINRYAAGDAFAFLVIGKENFQKSFSMPWNGIAGVYNLMWSSEITLAQITGIQEFLFVVLGAVGTVVCAFVLRPSYTIWMFGNWFLFTSSGFILSVPRYTLAMFPLYILFARLAERRVWYSVITVWSLLFLSLFIAKFVQGHWTY